MRSAIRPVHGPPFVRRRPAIDIVPLDAVDTDAVEALLDRAFEPERRGRTAYKVRGSAQALAALSFAALDKEALIGTVQCWPVAFVPESGDPVPLVMVGPVAVAPERQRDGVGRELMAASLAAALAQGCDDRLVLIGDPEYYGRFFGFTAAHTRAWRLPGPVEQHRLLTRGDRVPDGPGELGPV